MPERDPKAEAVVLAPKAEGDAKAMELLASNPEISDETSAFTLSKQSRSGSRLCSGLGGSSSSTPTICIV